DFDLAEIYGYDTRDLTKQVNNNFSKFEGDDFSFILTDKEFTNLMSKKSISSWGGRRKNPRAFTESGIYMIMTVLRGELAVRQSRALIRTFRAMKDHIVAGSSIAGRHDMLQLSLQVNENRRETEKIKEELTELGTQMSSVMDRLGNVVERSEIAPFMLDFSRPEERREYLFLDGQPVKSDLAYMEIYGRAKRSIHIVDDYISLKTLHLLCGVDNNIRITIISDNLRGLLHESDYQDCIRENPDFHVEFIRSMGASHDRFIVLDHGTDDERLFHCGSSSKDSGNRIPVISELLDPYIRTMFSKRLSEMLGNPLLVL
ncbi:MAG: ORF6N domain-containing protein, partial [Spirochaetales bacterium]|nr:ORF6N domain-containing protein [Spirochaetales bacterium]